MSISQPLLEQDRFVMGHANVMLDVQAVHKSYGSSVALEEVSLSIRQGEFLTLLGPSGSGKTTLLKLIVGFEVPTGGAILLRDRDISRLSPAERGVGMVFQQYALFPHMTVAENIAYGLKMRRVPKAERDAKVSQMLDLLRLDTFAQRLPKQLSGGQQQRVALGRALAYDPEIILMDEPLGALDKALRLEMEEEIRRIHRDLRATVVYVTHDQQEALALSDRIAIMRAGKIVGLGTPEELYYTPPNSFVATFFGNANLLPVDSCEPAASGAGATVKALAQEVVCPSASGVTRDTSVHLVVRRGAVRWPAQHGDFLVGGTVQESLLLGHERELVLTTNTGSRMVFLLDARESVDLRVGDNLEVGLIPSDLLLVPDVD